MKHAYPSPPDDQALVFIFLLGLGLTVALGILFPLMAVGMAS